MYVTFAAAASDRKPCDVYPMRMVFDGLDSASAIPRSLEFKTREEFLDWWRAYGVRLWQNWASAVTRGEDFATTIGL